MKTSGAIRTKEARTRRPRVRDRSGIRARPGSPESRALFCFDDEDAAVIGIVVETNGNRRALYWACDVPARKDGGRSLWVPWRSAARVSHARAQHIFRRVMKNFALAEQAAENAGTTFLHAFVMVMLPLDAMPAT